MRAWGKLPPVSEANAAGARPLSRAARSVLVERQGARARLNLNVNLAPDFAPAEM